MGNGFIFSDRCEAGRLLAERLGGYRNRNPIVLGLPRGGIVVGYEIARALGAPLDVIVVRKLGAPDQPELGIGAIAPGNVLVLDAHIIQVLGLTHAEVQAVARREAVELERRLRLYRGQDGLPDVRGRTVILVDDGLATGVTARAAIRAVRRAKPRRIILGVGVCARETADAIREEVDDLVCVSLPRPFRAVGHWYEDFRQTPDEDVLDFLEKARLEEHLKPEGPG